ncbi:MAG TPA: ABC transporter ATP-binding protein [Dermatophilaceae bacterium]|nr:ABC transporter ATP-binding protein [Dermatophilaceae bacterium]
MSVSAVRDGMRIVWIGVRREPRWFAVAVAGSAVYGVMTVGTAAVLGRVVDTIVTPAVRARQVTAGQLWQAGLLMAGVVLLNVAGIITRRVAANVTMLNVGAHYRRQVTRQYLRLPLSWHHRHPSGQLLSNANADVEATWMVFAPLPMALGVLVMLAVGVVQMVVVDVVLAVIGLTVFPLLFAVNAAFQRVMSPRVTLSQQLRAEVSEVAHESFEAAMVVKALGREEHEAARFVEVAGRLRDANVEVGRTRGRFDPAIEAIPTLGTLLVLAIGTARVAAGAVTAAEVVQIAYLFSLLSFPVRALGWVLAELPRTVVGWNRVNAVLQATGEMAFGQVSLPQQGRGRARTSGATYGYDVSVTDELVDKAPPAVRDVTLDVPAGGTVALVGPTGSGKSTLASLVLRLVDPDSGVVTIDGVDLREVRRGGVAAVAALVPQQTFVFDDTVRGNITLGADYTDEQVWEALRVSQADGFVAALEHGLDTRVGERGASLSGGQRQRIALARAVVRQPRLLVLDDATSAVDPSVEQAILGALRDSSRGTTVLVVAYRMATIALADEVVYLERGVVVDHGTHAQLRQRCAGYAKLVTAYAREAAERAAIAADEEDVRVGGSP